MSSQEYLNNLKIINKFYKNKTYHIYNKYGLGDSVFNIILFRIIKNFIIKNNIKIYYYTKDIYITQLNEFIYDIPNIKISSLRFKPEMSIELWINTSFYGFTHEIAMNKAKKPTINYNKFYRLFFNNVLNKIGFNISINRFVYFDQDLINRYHSILDKYKHFDILILNSTPFSGQYDYIKSDWDNYIIKLNKKFRILTTTKVDNVLCTTHDNLSIKDIASLSMKAKVIIAINSGVFPGLLNYYTLTTVRHFYIFDKRCSYSYPNFENKKNITDISFEELEHYIN